MHLYIDVFYYIPTHPDLAFIVALIASRKSGCSTLVGAISNPKKANAHASSTSLLGRVSLRKGKWICLFLLESASGEIAMSSAARLRLSFFLVTSNRFCFSNKVNSSFTTSGQQECKCTMHVSINDMQVDNACNNK